MSNSTHLLNNAKAQARMDQPDLQDLTEALREVLSHYCPGCGFGSEGCATIQHRDCRMLALLERAEGRKLKLNGEPVGGVRYARRLTAS